MNKPLILIEFYAFNGVDIRFVGKNTSISGKTIILTAGTMSFSKAHELMQDHSELISPREMDYLMAELNKENN